MNVIRVLSVVAAMLPASLLAQSPEPPAIMRVATGVIRNSTLTPATHTYTRPHLPAFRTSNDGRIGCVVEGGGSLGGSSTPCFTLLKPEQMSSAFLNNAAGAFVVSDSNPGNLTPAKAFVMVTSGLTAGLSYGRNFTDGVIAGGSHFTLWDDGGNPTSVAGEDVYNLKLLCTSGGSLPSPDNHPQFFVTPISVTVSNPKLSTAKIRVIAKTGPTLVGAQFSTIQGTPFEPVVCGDGRLLVVRIGSPSLPWTDPVTGTPHTGQGCDIIYSYYETGVPADPTKWTTLLPISHAPYDSRINTKFGFAMAPFRDPEGTLIADGEDIGGSYPWIDREARNLFFETMFDQLHYLNPTTGKWTNARYPIAEVAEQPANWDKIEDGGKHQGVSFCGLWSHGKIVMMDNMVNDTDYAVGAGDNSTNSALSGPEQRFVQLYQADAARGLDGWLRMGYGRATIQMPLGDNDNANIIDSVENIFNYLQYAKPISNRDVAWLVSVGKQTDELSFDDYLDPDAFIIANMAGLLTFNNNGTSSNNFTHQSGWNTTTHLFSGAVKLQNAATAPSSRWTLPKHGLVRGTGRLEPAAVGGVHGKGFWMDGTTGLEFTIPTQPVGVDVTAKSWYIGLFVDCRTTDDTVERRLATFPDGSIISIIGRHQIVYTKGAAVVNRISLPPVLASAPVTAWDDLLPDTSWAHLAFQVRKAGTEVDFHLNGLVFNRWQDPFTSLFQMTAGTLTLGRPNLTTVAGFTGWVDDFKVIAHAVDLETACNHANGTLIGLPSTYTGDWKTKFADRFPAWTHDVITAALKNNGEATYPKYACYYNYQQDDAAHRFTIPAGAVSVRQSVHFPEGPLYYNKPRPHSVQNQFCLTCHKTPAGGVGNGGLDLDAITFDSTYTADQDPRRQPMQPPRRVYGQIPAGIVDTTGLPSTATALPAAGQLLDQWMQPAFPGTTAVQSYSVVDPVTGLDLMQLPNNGVIDPAKIGLANITIRANLDTAQGYVNMQYDAGAVNQRLNPPYAVFGNAGNPLAGQVLLPGVHTVKATPQFGALNTLTFTVAGNASRVVADYRDDFKTHSPLPGWSYQWNANGPITSAANYVYMAWSTSANKYSGKGSATFPEAATEGSYVSLTSGGGHPGRGTTQAQTNDRFAIAAYTVKSTGFYGISNGFVTGSSTLGNGGQVIVYTENNAGVMTQKLSATYAPGTTLNLTALNVGQLQAGDTIYVCVGPNTTDGNDSFTLDFSIYCNELANPL